MSKLLVALRQALSLVAVAAAMLVAGCGGGGGGLDAAAAGDGGGAGGSAASGSREPGGAPGAAGTLTGHTVSSTDFHGFAPDQTGSYGPLDSVVGEGLELNKVFFAGFASVDFSGDTLRIVAEIDQPFGYLEVLRFADKDGTISRFASVSVDPATDYDGFDASRLSVTADAIDVNLTALSGRRGQQIVLRIQFAL